MAALGQPKQPITRRRSIAGLLGLVLEALSISCMDRQP